MELLFKSYVEKINLLHQSIEFLQAAIIDKEEVRTVIGDLKNLKISMINKVEMLKKEHKEQDRLINEMNDAKSTLENLERRCDVLNELIVLKDKEEKGSECIDEQKTNSSTGSAAYDFTPITENKGLNRFRPIKYVPKVLYLDIEHVTNEEFTTVPKYLVGRVKLAVINAFIDELNKAFKDKYSLLSKPKSSLKSKYLPQYLIYKNQITELELKGKYFLMGEDIAATKHLQTLDKTSLSFLNILRFLKRITEVRKPGGRTVYII